LLLIFWLFVLSAVAYLDRVNISIAGTLLASEFHLPKFSSAGFSAPSSPATPCSKRRAAGSPTNWARGAF